MLVRVDKSWNAGLAFCRFQEKLSFCKSWKELSVTSHLLCDQSFKIYFSRMLMLIFSVKTTSSVGRCLSPHQTLAVIFYQLKIRWRREDLASFFFFFHCWQTSSRTWPANTVAFDCYGCYVSYYVILLSCNVKIPVSCFFCCLREVMVLKCLCYLVLQRSHPCFCLLLGLFAKNSLHELILKKLLHARTDIWIFSWCFPPSLSSLLFSCCFASPPFLPPTHPSLCSLGWNGNDGNDRAAVQRGIASRWLRGVDQKYFMHTGVSEKPSILYHAIFTACLHNKYVLKETPVLLFLKSQICLKLKLWYRSKADLIHNILGRFTL